MADNDKPRKYHHPKKHPQHTRTPPGVQKAIQTFGVRDLREILDKKREQEDSQKPEQKLVKPPPPDPSYNFLKDPTREQSPILKKKDSERFAKKERPKDEKKNHQSHNREANVINKNDRIEEKICDNSQEKAVLKKQGSPQKERAPKKELRFDDNPTVEVIPPIIQGVRRNSFRGRIAKRGGGAPKENKDHKIENPVNIKIELSIETGMRNCTLDENTKIPDIKHVPDKISYPQRGSFRGSRGGFRGRGRGRGSFRGRGGSSFRGKGGESFDHSNSKNFEGEQKLVDEKDNSEQNENNVEHFEYDSNENYDQEFSSEYHDSPDHLDNSSIDQKYENSPESGKYCNASRDVLDSNLRETITITSSKFQDGEIQRSIEVKANSQSDIENQNENSG